MKIWGLFQRSREWLLQFGLPNFIDGVTGALTRLSDWAAANPGKVGMIAEIILSFLAGLWVYNTTKKLISFLITLGTQFMIFGGQIAMAGLAATMGGIAFGALLWGVMEVSKAWKDMSGWQRVAAVLGLVVIAAVAAAAAVGALQSAWSLGIAAVAIVAGVSAIAYSINKAQKDAVAGLGNFGSMPNVSAPDFSGASGGGGGGGSSGGPRPGPGPISAMATGGFVTAPTLAMVGERSKKEAVLPLEQNTGWADILAEKLAERLGGSGPDKDAPINVIMQVDGSVLAKVTARNISELQRQSGKTLIPV